MSPEYEYGSDVLNISRRPATPLHLSAEGFKIWCDLRRTPCVNLSNLYKEALSRVFKKLD